MFGDFSRLSQIFSNVLHNAAKYTSDGGSIELKVAVDRGSVAVRVRDNGIGIDAQFLPHVFEVFTQGYRGLDRSQGGLGVGLAVVRRLVELHQGEVNVSSDGPGRGTEVSVTLPCISEVVPHAGIQMTPATRQGGKRILVVDDNADAAESIAVFMRIEGHEVKTVTDAMQALACLEVFAPHVAIIDIGLPGMNGYELATGIRANKALRTPMHDRADGLWPGGGLRPVAGCRFRSSLRQAGRSEDDSERDRRRACGRAARGTAHAHLETRARRDAGYRQ